MHDHPTGERTCNVTTPVQLVTTRQVKIDSGRMHALSMNAHPQRLCSNITFVIFVIILREAQNCTVIRRIQHKAGLQYYAVSCATQNDNNKNYQCAVCARVMRSCSSMKTIKLCRWQSQKVNWMVREVILPNSWLAWRKWLVMLRIFT